MKKNIDASISRNNDANIYNSLDQKVYPFKQKDRNFACLNVTYLTSGMYFVVPNQ